MHFQVFVIPTFQFLNDKDYHLPSNKSTLINLVKTKKMSLFDLWGNCSILRMKYLNLNCISQDHTIFHGMSFSVMYFNLDMDQQISQSFVKQMNHIMWASIYYIRNKDNCWQGKFDNLCYSCRLLGEHTLNHT